MEYLYAFNEGLVKVLPLSAQGTETFLYMMLGMAIGFAVGILPGLGGATTLALMLPFIYNMDPITAFAFLLGSNAVTATTAPLAPDKRPQHHEDYAHSSDTRYSSDHESVRVHRLKHFLFCADLR